VKVTAETSTPDSSQPAEPAKGVPLRSQCSIASTRDRQLRVGTVRLEGNDHVDAAKLTPLLNTSPGQLLSPQNLASDRDALLTDYLSRGFDQVRVEVRRCSRQLTPPMWTWSSISPRAADFCAQGAAHRAPLHAPDTVAKAHHAASGDPLNENACLRRSAISMNSRSSTRSIRRSKIRPAKSR